MTPQERDSLLKITKPGDTINIDQARTQNIGTSVGEMIGQLRQDMAFSEGKPLIPLTISSLILSPQI